MVSVYPIVHKINFMKFTFSKDFQAEKYESCLEEIGALIEKLRVESGCSVKPLMSSVHIGHSMLKGVYEAK